MKTTCMIIEDDLDGCQLLSGLLHQIPGVEVIGTTREPNIARLMVLANKPNLIFLEVCNSGLSRLGYIDSLRSSNNHHSEIVIVSGSDTFTLEAIHREVFDYLLKPVSQEVLIETICRYKRRSQFQVSPNDPCYGKLKFNTLQGFFLINVSDIVFIEADGNYSTVHLTIGSKKLITVNIGQVEDLLLGYNFFRIDRSLIINLRYLTDINRKSRKCTLVNNGSTLNFPINRLRIKQLTEFF